MNKDDTDKNESNIPQADVSGVVRCLKLISGGRRVVIGATQGTETLASADEVFSSISPDFKNWGCDKTEQETPEVAVLVYDKSKTLLIPRFLIAWIKTSIIWC